MLSHVFVELVFKFWFTHFEYFIFATTFFCWFLNRFLINEIKKKNHKFCITCLQNYSQRIFNWWSKAVLDRTKFLQAIFLFLVLVKIRLNCLKILCRKLNFVGWQTMYSNSFPYWSTCKAIIRSLVSGDCPRIFHICIKKISLSKIPNSYFIAIFVRIDMVFPKINFKNCRA